jgi:uncharacterized protein
MTLAARWNSVQTLAFTRRLFWGKLLIIIALFGLLSTQATAASFDCKKAATWVEKIVCSDEVLSQFDDQLAKAYHEALTSLSPEGQKETKQYQKQWLKNLSPFCKARAKFKFDDSTVKCLKNDYEGRIRALQQILIKFPDRSFRNVYVDASEIDKTCGDDNVYVDVGFVYPQIEIPRHENEKFWNNLVSQKANDHINNHKKGEGGCADVSIVYIVGFSNRHLISYQDASSQYDHGAPHGYSVIYFFNWLLEDKRELKASDLFDDKTSWRNKLVALVAQKKKEQEAADKSIYRVPGEDLKSGLINIDKLTSSNNWMIAKDGLVLRLDAWNSSHSVLFTIDWKTLDPYLSKNGRSLFYD